MKPLPLIDFNPILKFAVPAILISILLGSCTMEKRVHRNGWYVNWRSPAHHRSELAIKEHPPSDTTINIEKKKGSDHGIIVTPLKTHAVLSEYYETNTIGKASNHSNDAKPMHLNTANQSTASPARLLTKPKKESQPAHVTPWHVAGAIAIFITGLMILSNLWIVAGLLAGLICGGVFLLIYWLIYFIVRAIWGSKEERKLRRQMRHDKKDQEIERMKQEKEKLRAEREKSEQENSEAIKAEKKAKSELKAARTALIFSILGLFPLIIIGSIIGLILAQSVINKNTLEDGNKQSLKIARAAKVFSIVTLILYPLGIIMGIAVAAAVISDGWG